MKYTVATVAVTIALLTSCNNGPSERAALASVQQSFSSQVAPPAPAGPADYIVDAVSVGTPTAGRLIDITWKDQSGKTVRLSEYAKGKVVFLNFWATWCPPCRREIPDIVELSREMSNDLVVIGISLDDGSDAKAKVIKFAMDKGITYINIVPSATFSTKAIAEAYSVIAPINAIPTTFIFDRNGNHKQTIIGANTKSYFADAVKKAM
ncbi:MAG: TlpA disulfide reductase family protein [Bacteroidota bacterium]|nr:TlpA family protein disulfide reductase [Candidatus Kapabacteria bacterium]MCS7301938.1 TlpA family protein disulfide reductase [Candidatus Kapabacteria bacterium]MCX7936606.1 TlpA family protein disulfide reductase [Chlorobiota bacterium]MDW8074799.1 TlpA disulfide reductase family protein [Bacteroidota bacterium]MDW8271438.1 TlpA disulfide reductase family protein [Bacteroidota bacterium]